VLEITPTCGMTAMVNAVAETMATIPLKTVKRKVRVEATHAFESLAAVELKEESCRVARKAQTKALGCRGRMTAITALNAV